MSQSRVSPKRMSRAQPCLQPYQTNRDVSRATIIGASTPQASFLLRLAPPGVSRVTSRTEFRRVLPPVTPAPWTTDGAGYRGHFHGHWGDEGGGGDGKGIVAVTGAGGGEGCLLLSPGLWSRSQSHPESW